MKELATTILVLSVAACGPSLTARERYVQALNHRLSGNTQAYFDGMLALAHEDKDSRAGRRARATLGSGDMMTQVAVAGMLAAIAVPNFLKFQARAKQSEAKSNLKAMFIAQKVFFAEQGRYCMTFRECGWQPEEGARYLYILGPQEAVGADKAESLPLLHVRASAALDELGIKPRVTKRDFLIAAVGNIDSDGGLDIWTIDDNNELQNLNSDVD